MNDDLPVVAQCLSCGQWRVTESMRMVQVKPQDGIGYSCRPCYLAMQRPA